VLQCVGKLIDARIKFCPVQSLVVKYYRQAIAAIARVMID